MQFINQNYSTVLSETIDLFTMLLMRLHPEA